MTPDELQSELQSERQAFLERKAKREAELRAKAPKPLPEKPKWWGARYCQNCGKRQRFDKGQWLACGCTTGSLLQGK